MTGASVLPGTGLEIYEVPAEGNTPPRHHAAIRERVLLGRGSSAEGFLVEYPRPEGARWLGLASVWEAERP